MSYLSSTIICDTNNSSSSKDYPTNYYYVVDNITKLLPFDNNNIYVVDNKDDDPESADKVLSKLHTIIEDSCNEYNIVLYILLQNSANINNNFIELFNEYIQNIRHISFLNMIIFSYVNEGSYNLVKIDSNYLNKYCIGNIVTNKRKKFYKIFNVCTFAFLEKKNYKRRILRISSQKDHHSHNKPKPAHNIRYNFLETPPVTNLDIYGISYLKNEYIPKVRCYFGALRQFSGTCWMNSILNALMLPKISKKIMLINLYYYKTPNDKLSLTELHTKKDSISYKNIISSIIYNIFIKKYKLEGEKNKTEKEKEDQINDYSNILAYKMKHIIVDQEIAKATTALSKASLLEKSLSEAPLSKKARTALYFYSDHKKTFNNPNHYYYEGIGIFGRLNIEALKFIMKDYIKLNLLYKIIEYKEGEIIQKTIDGNKKLISCIISLPRHDICGFICGDTEYIFDANFPKSYVQDNWSSLHFENYNSSNEPPPLLSYINLKNDDIKEKYLPLYREDPNKCLKITSLIYCKEELTTFDLQKTLKRKNDDRDNTYNKFINVTKKRMKI
jgi:hypothetical protein